MISTARFSDFPRESLFPSCIVFCPPTGSIEKRSSRGREIKSSGMKPDIEQIPSPAGVLSPGKGDADTPSQAPALRVSHALSRQAIHGALPELNVRCSGTSASYRSSASRSTSRRPGRTSWCESIEPRNPQITRACCWLKGSTASSALTSPTAGPPDSHTATFLSSWEVAPSPWFLRSWPPCKKSALPQAHRPLSVLPRQSSNAYWIQGADGGRSVSLGVSPRAALIAQVCKLHHIVGHDIRLAGRNGGSGLHRGNVGAGHRSPHSPLVRSAGVARDTAVPREHSVRSACQHGLQLRAARTPNLAACSAQPCFLGHYDPPIGVEPAQGVAAFRCVP